MKFNYALPDLAQTELNTEDGNSPLEEYLANQLFKLFTQKQNLHGRRIGKAKDAINPGDYVTKRQIASNLFGTLAQRPSPNSVTQGTTYYATDRTVSYISISGHWYYRDGIQRGLLSAKPSPSVLYDNGYRYYATDYDWEFVWNLITWERVGGANLYVESFQVAPTKNGWGLCDGTTYTYSKDDGSTGTVTTDDLVGTPRFQKLGPTHSLAAAHAATITGSVASDGSHNHTLTPLGSLTGSVTGNLPNHTHDVGTDNIGTGSIFVSDAKSSQSGHVGDPWVATATIGGSISGTSDSNGSHSHTVTPTGTVTGNLPAHTHDATNTYTGPPKTGGGSAWTNDPAFFTVDASGVTIGGTLDLPNHTHDLTALTNTFTSGIQSADHRHDDGTYITTITTTDDSGFNHTGSTLAVIDVPNTNNVSGLSGYNDTNHEHDTLVDFSASTTDNPSGATVPIDTSGLTIDGSSISVKANTEHYHIVDFPTGGITSPPVAITLTFAGGSNTTSSNGSHTHGLTSISSAGLTFTDTSPGHFHNLSGHTDSVIGTIALSLTNTMGFSGSITTTTSDGAHTHGVGTLANDATSTPITVQLIPYIRL